LKGTEVPLGDDLQQRCEELAGKPFIREKTFP